MPWRSGILVLFFAFLCHVNNGISDRNIAQGSSNIDIQFDNEPMETVQSSGGGFPSDDEDFGVSGSGSGSGYFDLDSDEESRTTDKQTSTRRTTTPMPMTECMKERQKQEMLGKPQPSCTDRGDYSSRQCPRDECFCVDMNNVEIPHTRQKVPNKPDCETGVNLSPCIFELVKAHRPYLLGAFKPDCDGESGQYKPVQCHGSVCYCVDPSTGRKEMGTDVAKPSRPQCGPDAFDDDDSSEEEVVTLRPPYVVEGVDPQIVFPDSEGPDGENVNIDGEHDDDKKEGNGSEGDENKTGTDDEGEIGRQGGEDKKSSIETADEIMTQPGIMAGIIGGAVVLLLCLVLLIMFIVYRMRKKDEGSYPLDEPRRPANYAYVRTPDKEFYA